MEPGFNPALEAQAIGRVHRLGQKREVEICRLIVKDSIESRMVKFVQKKYGLSFDESSSASVSEDGDKEAGKKREQVDSSAAAFQQVVGNLQTERAQVLTEEFDELFGVQDRVTNAGHGNNATEPFQGDDEDFFPDMAMSGFL
jgi:hypothetical protein